ncbi:hypothetical protein TNCV_1007621 [Trichonephila clavipes]|nr:hypothetical protein TNCV_1007621 [Trichonephila clavipes]
MNNEASDYSLTKGKLLIKSRKDKNGDIRQLLVIPEKFRSSILKMGHEGTSGHLGVTKTKSRIARYFYWPQCYKEIEEFVKTCDPCQRAGKANDQKKALMQLVPVISVFSKLNVDAVGPLPTTPTGNKYLLTVMCMSSKYPDAVSMPDIASTTVVETLFQIFSRMGFPKEIQTDQGTLFTSILTSVFFENFGINVVRSSVYHPQSTPVERFHRTLKRILRVICIESSPEWEKQLPAALFALRTITHESTGKTHLVEHDIELINDVPIRTKPYRMSARQTDLLQEEIRKMLKYQVIEIGESDYASPMILVETPGKDPRPCIDYRKLNEVIRTQFYPLPNIEHRTETVAAAKYITFLDLTKGYWQIPLTPKAQSRLTAELLQGCEKFVLPYLDDVAIFSENWDDHISHIDKVLERIRDARLTIKPAKCKFAQDSVKYLGHVVGLGKRSPAQLKVQTILDFPVPRTKTQVRAFLGIAGYYRQYIPMFSSSAAPLTELLKGKSKKGYINWTSECQESFVKLKEKLSTNPVLYAPDFKRQFILQTDASDTGIGIVLAQRNDRGEEHPILYLSKKFSDAEREGLLHN